MTQYRLTAPALLQATVGLPASKSISNRALAIHFLSRQTGRADDPQWLPANLSDCDDTLVMARALASMPDVIDIRAAGTAMRFMTAILATTDSGTHLLTGTDRMKQRPIGLLVDALRHLGADIAYAGQEGFPPLRISGHRVAGGALEIAANVSSQYISALLLAGPMMEKGLTLRLVGELVSRPYIDLTLWTMREYGADAEWTAVDTIEVKPRPYVERPYTIESDWSAASYWYEMVALSRDADAQVRLEGLMDGSKQGDSSVRYLFSLLGVKTVFDSKEPGVPTTVTLKKSGRQVTRMEYDFSGAPDLAQTLVVTCAALGVPFRFSGLQTLRIKETDRIEALKREMMKAGYVVHSHGDSILSWDGETTACTGVPAIDTYEDHRMALSFAPLSLRQPVAINDPHVVSKSYPRFWDDLAEAGFVIDKHETPAT